MNAKKGLGFVVAVVFALLGTDVRAQGVQKSTLADGLISAKYVSLSWSGRDAFGFHLGVVSEERFNKAIADRVAREKHLATYQEVKDRLDKLNERNVTALSEEEQKESARLTDQVQQASRALAQGPSLSYYKVASVHTDYLQLYDTVTEATTLLPLDKIARITIPKGTDQDTKR